MNRMVMVVVLLRIISWLIIGLFTPDTTNMQDKAEASRIQDKTEVRQDSVRHYAWVLSVDR